MSVCIFSNAKKEFLSMPSFDEHKWSGNINDAYLFNESDIDINEVFNSPFVPGSGSLLDCAWVNPNLIETINRNTLVSDLLNFLMALNDDDKVTEILNEFSHEVWELYTAGRWQCNNTHYTLEDIEIYILENKIDPEHICDMINSITNKVTYWINEDDEITSTPRPSLSTFKKSLEMLMEEMETIINFSLKNDGDCSESSQRLYVLNQLLTLQAAVNGTTQDDVKGVEES